MQITDVKIKELENPTGKMAAIASITIDKCFVIHNIKIINGDKGWFIAMPSKKADNGAYLDICHPINNETRAQIQDIVLTKYLKGEQK